jgi:Rad3-related DNA helicase
MSHPRLMWHTKHNKQAVLADFRAAPASEGSVLVCSGLYEGVDLPFDDDSWQVIGKVPYPSLGDEEVLRKMTADADWYDWQAIKRLLQAYGRLPRRTDGHGTTYIFDLNYERLLKADKARPVRMFPSHYMAATQGGVK